MSIVTFEEGSLARISNIRHKPAGAASRIGIQPVIPRADVHERLILYVEPQQVNTNLAVNLIFAYHLSRFYSVPGQTDLSPNALLTAGVGLVANMGGIIMIAPWDDRQAMALAGIDIVFKNVTLTELAELTITDERFRRFLGLWADVYELGSETHIFFILACVNVLVMRKNLNHDNYDNWFKNRINGFAGTIGERSLSDKIPSSTYPPMAQMIKYHDKFSSSFHVRKTTFFLVCALAESNIKNFIQMGCNEIVNLLRGVEINHLILIDKYIYDKYKELQYLSVMAGLDTVYSQAMQYLQKLPLDDWMYVRLLHDRDETNVLNRQNFDIYSTVATAAARYESSTYNNYYMNETESHKRIASLVTQYLLRRGQLTSIAAGDAADSLDGVGEHEKDIFFKKEIESFEDSLKAKKEEEKSAFRTVRIPGLIPTA